MSDTIKKIQAGTITYDIEPAQSAAIEVENKAPTLAWNTTSTVATIDGTDITVKLPANPDTNTTYSSKTAASGGTDVSLVTTGEKYIWNNKASTTAATTTTAGLMSAADKTKLDGVATGATKVTTDTVSG